MPNDLKPYEIPDLAHAVSEYNLAASNLKELHKKLTPARDLVKSLEKEEVELEAVVHQRASVVRKIAKNLG